jgi:hypothetical protein
MCGLLMVVLHLSGAEVYSIIVGVDDMTGRLKAMRDSREGY